MTKAKRVQSIEKDLTEARDNLEAKVTVYPPQAKPKPKRRRRPKLVRPHISQWEEQLLTKSEALLYKLNIGGQDPLAVPGTAGTKLTSHDVWAALVSIRTEGLAKHPTWGYLTPRKIKLIVVQLNIYRQVSLRDGSKDNEAHSVLFRELLYLIIDRKNEEGWRVRKPKILESIVLAAIDHVCEPAKYANQSERFWSRKIGISDNKDWNRIWRKRYHDFLNDLTALDVFACDELERQL